MSAQCLRALAMCIFLPSVMLVGCGTSNGSPAAPTATRGSSSVPAGYQIGKRTKTSGCTWHLPIQDLACTPGAIFPAATKAQICVPGYSRRTRRVSSSTKRRAYLEYGIKTHKPFTYEVDHLISLELGGTNAIANLWPEPASPVPGFHQKDVVENYLHQQVCDGKIPLAAAQYQIATNWIAVYNRIPH